MNTRRAHRRAPRRPLSTRCPQILCVLVVMQFGLLSYLMMATPASGDLASAGVEQQAQQVDELRREKQRLEATNAKLTAQMTAEDSELAKERGKLTQALEAIGHLRASASRSRQHSAGAGQPSAERIRSAQTDGKSAAGATEMLNRAKISVGSGTRVLQLTLPGEGQRKRVPQLLVGVFSEPGARVRRDAIRETWATKFASAEWKLVFVVGSATASALVMEEAEAHNDMLLVDVADEYRNQPLKMAALFRAARSVEMFHQPTMSVRDSTELCGKQLPCWVLKTHDQAFVDVPLVQSIGEGISPGEGTKVFAGTAINAMNPVLRDGMYGESRNDFPAEHWPPYVSAGTGALVSADLVQCMLGKINSPGFHPLHVEDAALGVLAAECGAKPDVQLVGMVQGFTNTPDDQLQSKLRSAMDSKSRMNPDDLPYHFNKRASRLVGELRTQFPELRDPRCKNRLPDAKKLASDGWDTSIIITFVEEEPTTLVRTVRTILKNTPSALLREIILVDDGSSKGWLDQMYPTPSNSVPSVWPQGVTPRKILDYIVAMDPAKVKVIHAKRAGFIASRGVGIAAAKGKTFCIMESHVEPLPGWLEPLLEEVRINPETIANPIINQIKHDDFTWVGPVYTTMDYNNQFEMVWGNPGAANDQANLPKYKRPPVAAGEHVPWGSEDVSSTLQYMTYASAVHAGGIYVATKQFFYSLQGYDPGMHGFSSENLDFAFRAWLCSKNGRNVVVPCSLVGHVYRMKSPAATLDIVTPEKINVNKKRCIETWLDTNGDGAGYTKDASTGKWWGKCYDGKRCEMPALLKEIYEARHFDLNGYDAGDMSERKAWIRQHCRPFSWMTEHVAKPVGAKMPTDGF